MSSLRRWLRFLLRARLRHSLVVLHQFSCRRESRTWPTLGRPPGRMAWIKRRSGEEREAVTDLGEEPVAFDDASAVLRRVVPIAEDNVYLLARLWEWKICFCPIEHPSA